MKVRFDANVWGESGVKTKSGGRSWMSPARQINRHEMASRLSVNRVIPETSQDLFAR